MRRRSCPTPGTVNFGDLGHVEPIGRKFGGDRGTPLDRYYIEGFLKRHAGDITGRVAEIGDDFYTRRFGGNRVRQSDIIDTPTSLNARSTLRVDLQMPHQIEAERFDCMIVTQTLHMIYHLHGALATIERALAPGGIVLATVPGITPIDEHDGPEKWFWSMTQSAARRLFEEHFGTGQVVIEQFGNVLAATAFLQGLAFEEVEKSDLDNTDPLYPVITGIWACKAARTK
jgi:SAM-dependent methyltransferase